MAPKCVFRSFFPTKPISLSLGDYQRYEIYLSVIQNQISVINLVPKKIYFIFFSNWRFVAVF